MAITLDGTTGITAAEFDGTVEMSNLTGTMDASKLTGTLPSIDGSSLTGIDVITEGSKTAQIGNLKMAWGYASVPNGGTAVITLPFSYTSTSSYEVQAIAHDGNHSGATRGAQGARISGTNQIVLAKAAFSSAAMHWFTIGY